MNEIKRPLPRKTTRTTKMRMRMRKRRQKQTEDSGTAEDEADEGGERDLSR